MRQNQIQHFFFLFFFFLQNTCKHTYCIFMWALTHMKHSSFKMSTKRLTNRHKLMNDTNRKLPLNYQIYRYTKTIGMLNAIATIIVFNAKQKHRLTIVYYIFVIACACVDCSTHFICICKYMFRFSNQSTNICHVFVYIYIRDMRENNNGRNRLIFVFANVRMLNCNIVYDN